MTEIEKGFYSCRDEIYNRTRDLAKKIDELRTRIIARRDVLTSDESGDMFDDLASMNHTAEMMLFAFEEADKAIAIDLERNFQESARDREGF